LQIIGRTDPLTSCYRRRYGDERFADLLADNNTVSICLFDIDHFKQINDSFGHATGDSVLTTVGHLLRSQAQDGEVCRYGGEEFLIIWIGLDAPQTLTVANQLRTSIEQDIGLTDLVGHVTVSGGVATSLRHDTVGSMIERADAALYQAKKQGRNRILLANEITSLPREQPGS
jgi:diguanylate cyclase (GGDEF)-like protein